MPFVKKQTGSNFTLIPNDILEDKRINLKDIGLLCFLLHLPENWDFSVEGLDKILKNNGKSSVLSCLKHLEDAGYIVRFQARRQSGFFGEAVWVVSDTPLTKKDILELAIRYADYPSSETPSTENRSTDNRTQKNTKENKTLEINSNIDIENIKSDYSKVSKTKETNTKDDFLVFWEAYPKKVAKQAARKAFEKIKGVPIETVLSALELQKRSAQWKKDDGQFVPYPATWLNQRRWEDDPTQYGTSGNNKGKNPFAEMLREGSQIVNEQDADFASACDTQGSVPYALPEFQSEGT